MTEPANLTDGLAALDIQVRVSAYCPRASLFAVDVAPDVAPDGKRSRWLLVHPDNAAIVPADPLLRLALWEAIHDQPRPQS